MDEAVARLSVGGAREQAMGREIPDAFLEEIGEAFCRVVGVVEVDFHLAASAQTEGGKLGDDVFIVLFDGIKKGMSRTAARAVAMSFNQSRPCCLPVCDGFFSAGFVCVMKGLKVVANGDEDMQRLCGCTTGPKTRTQQIRRKPAVKGTDHAEGGLLPEGEIIFTMFQIREEGSETTDLKQYKTRRNGEETGANARKHPASEGACVGEALSCDEE